MPGIPGCEHCPWRDDPETPCLVARTGEDVWCHRVNPRRAVWTRGAADALRRATLEALGLPAPATFPPLREQVGNAAKAAVRFVAGGMKTTTPEERARRLAICADCPEFVGGKCARCGCYLMAKVRASTEHCPIAKW